MAITTLPPAPSRTDPSTFSAKADALLGALATFVTEANTLESNVNAKEASATSAASTATTKASEASSSASTATTKASEATTARNEAVNLVLRYQGALSSDPSVNKTGGALVAGDWYVNSSTGYIRAYNGSGWVQGISTVAGVTSVNGNTGAVTIDKTTVGLGNVDNTSDANKPISTATATALSNKQDTLVSGTNIKTINNTSILGSGDLQVSQKQVYSIGTSAVFSSNYNSFDEYNEYFLAASHASGTAYVRVCRVNSDGSISTGTQQTFSMYNTGTNSILVFMLSETAGCIIYPNASNYPEIRGIAINTSTLSVTIGNASSLGTNATFAGNNINGVKLTSQRLLVCYQTSGGVPRGYLGINLNTNGTLSNYYHSTGSTALHETIYLLDSTSAAVFGQGPNYDQAVVTFSGSSAPSEGVVLNSANGLPYSKYYVGTNYYVVGTVSNGVITNRITQARATNAYTTILPSYYNGFQGSALAYADDRVMIYNSQIGGLYNVGYYCPVSAYGAFASFPYYTPTGENMQIQGTFAHGNQLVGRQSVGMGRHGFAVDIGATRYYILSSTTAGSSVYIYAYK